MNIRTASQLTFAILFMVAFIPKVTIAQDNLTVKVEQEPYDTYYAFKKKKDHGIKRQVSILAYSRGSSYPDTLRIEEFDKKGDLVIDIGFSEKKRESYTTYEISADRKTKIWKSKRLGKSNTVWMNKTVYYDTDKVLWFQNTDLVNGDTVDKPYVKFTYSPSGQLLNKKQSRNGKVFMEDNYTYQGKDMVRAEVKITGSVAYTRSDYQYDNNHLPIKREEYTVRQGKPELYRTTYFTYKNGKLATKRYPDYSNPKLQVNVDFKYDEKGRISVIDAQCDTLYRHINYSYKEDKLVSIAAKGNTMMMFNGELFIYSSSGRVKPVFTYLKELTYDGKGNLIKMEQGFDGQAESKVDYSIEYFK